MKKLLVLILLFFLLFPLYSLEGEAGVSLGVLGCAFAFDVDNYDNYLYGRIFDFAYQLDNGWGITASPFIIHFNIADLSQYSFTFVNLSLFYNFFKSIRSKFFLGPFVSMNAVDLNNPVFIEFRSSINFRIRSIENFFNQSDIFNTDILLVELGYKYNKNNRHGFYIQIGLDLLLALGFLVDENDVREYEREQTWR